MADVLAFADWLVRLRGADEALIVSSRRYDHGLPPLFEAAAAGAPRRPLIIPQGKPRWP